MTPLGLKICNLSNINIWWIQLICLQFPLWKGCHSSPGHIRALQSSKLLTYLKKHKKKLPHTSPKREQMHTKTVFNHNKLCIYYAIRKSFTDSSLIVLSIQGIVTNCKGIAMKASCQTMNVKRNVNTFSDLTWCSMRKETCTYNELGEFLMVLGIGKRTGHSTLKNAKEKASPHNTLPQIQW